MKMYNEYFCLVSDDDGHWFICPSDKLDEFNDYLDDVSSYWKRVETLSRRKLISRDRPPEQPDWLLPIDGPHTIKFKEYCQC